MVYAVGFVGLLILLLVLLCVSDNKDDPIDTERYNTIMTVIDRLEDLENRRIIMKNKLRGLIKDEN